MGGTQDRSGNRRDGDGGERPVVPSNNFENYWRRKMGGRTQEMAPDNPQAIRTEQDRHDTAPPTRPCDPQSPVTTSAGPPSPFYASSSSAFSDLERSQTVDRFTQIATHRLGEAMSTGKMSSAWQNGRGSVFSWLLADYSVKPDEQQTCTVQDINPDDYAAERNLIRPHLTPIIWGSSCMVITFFSLRMGRWHQGRYAGKTFGSSLKKSTSNRATHNIKSLQDVRHVQQTAGSHPNNPFNPRKEQSESAMSSLSTLPVDAALSILVGISATLFLTTPGILMKDLSSSPLLEGKSVLAEELCLPFREEMENMNQRSHAYTPMGSSASDKVLAQGQVVPYSEIWKDENLQDFDSLRAVRDFVANCCEREKVSEQMADANSEIPKRPLAPPGTNP